MTNHGRVYCPRCVQAYSIVEAEEEPDEAFSVDYADDLITTCPCCGHELVVWQLSDDMRETLAEIRADELGDRPWEKLP